MNERQQYEAQIIGAVGLNGNELAPALADKLSVADFTGIETQRAWGAVQTLTRAGESVDVITISEQSGVELSVIAEFSRSAYSTKLDSVNTWANIIIEKARLDRLALSLGDVAQQAREPGADADAILQAARDAVVGAESDTSKEERRSIRQILDARLKSLDDKLMGTEDPIGLRTGVSDLDQRISGLKPQDLVIVAGRPSMGKSAFALQLLADACVKQGKRAAFFSLEMPEDDLADRMLSQLSGVKNNVIKNPQGHEDDLQRLTPAVKGMADADGRLHLIDDVMDIEGIQAVSRALAQAGGLDLIIIDYLQLITNRTGKHDNRTQEVGAYSRALKLLAKALNVPVVALSQLNRECETRPDKRPMMADLRESGSLEQDADKILMLYRDEVYYPESEAAGTAEIICRKVRGGEIGTVHSACDMSTYSFRDLAPEHMQHMRAPAARDDDPFA